MITVAQCASFAGLSPKEIILGASPSRRHEALLWSYLLNLHRGPLLNLNRGPVVIREMILSDLRTSLDLGAHNWAGDLFFVLRAFLSEYPEARRSPAASKRADSIPFTKADIVPLKKGETGPFVSQARCLYGRPPRPRKAADGAMLKLIERASVAARKTKWSRSGRE